MPPLHSNPVDKMIARKKSVSTVKPKKSPVSPSADRRRILLVDDHPMMRAGIAQLINQQPDLEVCCEAGCPAEAFAHLSKSVPDLLLTDMTMPGRSGVEFIKDVLALHPGLPMLILSMHDEGIYAERVLRAAAHFQWNARSQEIGKLGIRSTRCHGGT